MLLLLEAAPSGLITVSKTAPASRMAKAVFTCGITFAFLGLVQCRQKDRPAYELRRFCLFKKFSRKEMLLLAELELGPMTGPLTFHGLRHSYAMRQYARCRMQGMTPLLARLQVSKWLGHERDDVTRIYMAGATKNNDI